jgi:hypothetical protein
MEALRLEEKVDHARYYSPTVQVEKPLDVPKASVAYPSKLPDVVKVRLKASAVAQQVAVALYSSPSAGFREIYSNECRAARIACQRFGANPRIEVTVNPNERTLTVQGLDSLGITSEVFVEVLRYMGRTTNDQAGEVGQFGWGFFAVFTLTDELRLETYAHETKERYGVTAENAAGFKPLPDEEVSISEYGTKITLKVKQQIHLDDLVKWIEHYCSYSDIETYLTITADIKDEKWPQYDWVQREAGRSRLDGSFKDQLLNSIAQESWKPVYEVEIDKPTYYFYGAIADDEEHARTSNDKADLLLLRVPIKSEDLKGFEPPLTGWVLNVKDERRYPPTPDRDRFKEGAIKPITEEIQSILHAKFSKDFKLRTLEEYRRQKWRGVYSSRSKAWELFDDQTRALATMLNTNIARPPMEGEATAGSSYGRYRHQSTAAERSVVVEPLRRVVLRTDKVFYYPLPYTAHNTSTIMPAKRMAVTQKILRSKFDDAEVVTFGYPAGRYVYSEDDGLSSLQEFTVLLSNTSVNMDAKAEAEKIKKALGENWRAKCSLPEPEKNKPPPTDWPIHRWTTRGRVEAERVSIKKVPADIIRVPGKIEPYIEILQRAETSFGVTRDHPVMRGGTKLKDLLLSLKRKEATTQRGKMTFETIAKKSERLLVYLTDNPDILKHYAPRGQFMVAVEGDEAVELMTYLQAANREYATTRVPDGKAFKAKTGIDSAEEFVGHSLDIGGARRATSAYLGSCELRTSELKELLLAATEETYDPEKAEDFRKSALGLEKTI